MLRHVPFLGRSAAVMRNDQLTLLQELVGYANTFTQQAAGISAQIKNQTLKIAKFIESLADFFLRGLVKPGDVQVSNAGISSRIRVNSIGFSTPSREMLMCTVVPLGPLSKSATSPVLMFSVDFPSTAIITSPG